MAVELFEHNMTAYNSAKAMMSETGKAIIVHPTGTGKSFIGFRLAEDNPDKRVLWLTPSEYIVKTQLENLRNEGGTELNNITFVTYARLMRMTDEEMLELKPSFLVVDEAHWRWHNLTRGLWEVGYQRAQSYYKNNGDLDIPIQYRDDDGYYLGQWIYRQRKLYSDTGDRKNSSEANGRIEKLNSIGMIWK